SHTWCKVPAPDLTVVTFVSRRNAWVTGSNHRTGEPEFRTREFDFCAWIGRRTNPSSFTLDNTRRLDCGESLEPAFPVTKQLRGSTSRWRQGGLPSFPHPFGVRINHLLTILRRFPGVSIDLRVQGSVIAVKRALDHRAHRMALRAMLIDLEWLVAWGCSYSDDGCFSAAAAHFHIP